VPRTIIIGKAASGKDYMRAKLEERGYKYAATYTTRPKRVDEDEGKDYHFISDEEFTRMVEAGEFYETAEFNDWKYGTSKEQFYTKDIFIMTPSGVSQLSPEDREQSFIIMIDIDAKTRYNRLMQRDEHNKGLPGDSVKRRIQADENDFKDFVDYDVCISSPSF